MEEPVPIRVVGEHYTYRLFDSIGDRWWNIVTPEGGEPLDEYSGEEIAKLLNDQHAELTALRAEVERMRDERDRQYDQNTEQIVRISVLEAEVERLRAERRWIPVRERLPADDIDVICSYPGLQSFQAFRYGFDWFNSEGGLLAFPPTHWMPLPAPPKEEE